jgi:hypothetical protein
MSAGGAPEQKENKEETREDDDVLPLMQWERERAG